MTDKDLKRITASEFLRWAANGEPYNGIDENIWTYPTGKIRALAEAVTGEWPSDNEIFSIIADKIDAELAQARELSLRRGAELWAKANGWPDFKQGEDFGAWLERCALKLPCDKDGEPWSIGDRVMPGNRGESTVTGYAFDGYGWFLKYRWCGIDSYANEFATSCKRPAPEVLLCDGKPVSKGETVYVIESGIERTVKGFGTKLCEGMDGWDGSPWVMFDNGSWMRANDLTHERPVMGSDGLPIKDDETVYDVETGEAYIVRLPCAGTGKTFFRGGGYRDPAYLTHTPPDTQERIDADALKSCVKYWDCDDFSCGKCPALIDGKKPVEFYELDPIHDSCHEAQKLDLLRRQRELDARKGGTE